MKSKLRTVHVRSGKDISVPEGFSISHSVLIEPKKGKPYFTVLLSSEERKRDQLPGAIGYKVY